CSLIHRVNVEQQRQQQQRDINAAAHLVSLCSSSSLSHRGNYQNESENEPQGPIQHRHLLTASQNNTCHRGLSTSTHTGLLKSEQLGSYTLYSTSEHLSSGSNSNSSHSSSNTDQHTSHPT
ncbi:unnamed protein product, partial [Brugia timori]